MPAPSSLRRGGREAVSRWPCVCFPAFGPLLILSQHLHSPQFLHRHTVPVMMVQNVICALQLVLFLHNSTYSQPSHAHGAFD